MKLKIGTRRSMLALAQSNWVKKQLETKFQNLKVELVEIETQGDKDLSAPLSRLEGKDFFTKEIDLALINGTVDLTVHSFKDLSIDRPVEIVLAAIPLREPPQDIVIFSENIYEKLIKRKSIKIGTSSPRRLENTPNFLKKALPFSPNMTWVEIRGNVNTRLSRIFEEEENKSKLDGVVLAVAGLCRLWRDKNLENKLEQDFDLSKTPFMLLPLDQCPAAPAQGALAIECRSNDPNTLKMLSFLHHFPSAQQVASERNRMANLGGGCHQRYGITQINLDNFNIRFEKGISSNGKKLVGNDLFWTPRPTLPEEELVAFDSSEWRPHLLVSEDIADLSLNFSGRTFAAHSRAIKNIKTVFSPTIKRTLWTSGSKSWWEMAKLGHWVNGCAEGLGFSYLKSLYRDIQSTNFPLFNCKLPWNVLSHTLARGSWNQEEDINLVSTYALKFQVSEKAEKAIQNSTAFFWGSGSQFDAARRWLPQGARHACGPGKTSEKLKNFGIKNLDIFPSKEEWKLWVKRQTK